MYSDPNSPFTSGQNQPNIQAGEFNPNLNFQGNPSMFPPTTMLTPTSTISRSTLWMGELEPWMDEGVIRQIWGSLGYQVVVKVINNRSTGQSAGYCFVDFSSPSEAKMVLNNLQGATIPGTRKLFRLNWALGGNQPGEKIEPIPEYSIFVGDLADSVDDASLLALFRAKYPSARAAKVVVDSANNRPRGYGFVRFGNEAERTRSLTEMPGTLLQGRPIRVSLATPRSKAGPNASQDSSQSSQSESQLGIGYVDTSITTVFVGNLASDATEEDLRNYFQAFGEIDHIKIPPGKGCGFVQFAQRHQAERALAQLNGVQIGSNRVRLSWGRLPPDRSSQQQQQQQQQQRARMLMAQQLEQQEALYQSMGYGSSMSTGISPFTIPGIGNRRFNIGTQHPLDLAINPGWLTRADPQPTFPGFGMTNPHLQPPYPYSMISSSQTLQPMTQTIGQLPTASLPSTTQESNPKISSTEGMENSNQP